MSTTSETTKEQPATAVASSDGLECGSCRAWESEIEALYKAMGVTHDVETVDSACDVALGKIACLKHLAIEIAAHCECQCESGKRDCLFCVACRLVDNGISMTDDDDRLLDDAIIEAQYDTEAKHSNSEALPQAGRK